MTTLSAPAPETAMPRGPAIFFDGTSSVRHNVMVEATATGLKIIGQRLLDEWLYPELRRLAAPDGVLRLGRRGETLLARLEVRDQSLAAAIEDRTVTLDRGAAAERALRRKVVGLSIAATASLIITAIVGVPALTSRLIPLIPFSVELKLGNAVDKQVRSALDSHHLGAGFECGNGPGETAGRNALQKLVARLEAAADLPFALHVDVVRRDEPNAFALPGGHIYVYQGLIDQAQSPDELAGVLAHEIGHVAHRDGTRTVLQTAGLSFLFGMMLGDFVGGGAVVIAAKTVLRSSYSRRVEASADAYSVALMNEAGGNAHALATILSHIMSDKEHGMKILLDHPETKERISAIDALAGAGAAGPLLDAGDWSALKQICALPAGGAASGNGPATKADSDGAATNH
jgi:Zn-dependent protease with chaperone function